MRPLCCDSARETPTAIDGQPVASRVPQGDHGPTNEAAQAITLLRGVQGYDVTAGDLAKWLEPIQLPKDSPFKMWRVVG